MLFIVILHPSLQRLPNDMRAPDLSPGDKLVVRSFSGMPFSFNNPLCVECIMLPSGIISTFPCFIGAMFVAGALVVMRWFPDSVSDMPLPWGFCVEEVGYPMVSTISGFFWIKFILLLTVLLPVHSSQISHVFPPCGLSFVDISMCPGIFMVNSLLMCLHHLCYQQYSRGSGR